MNENSTSFKSSPLGGMIIIVIGMIFGAVVLFITFFYFFPVYFEMSLIIAALLIMALFIFMWAGYIGVLSKEITIDESGIIFKQRNNVLFNRRWYEISKIKTMKKWGAEEDVPVVEVFFSDGDVFEIGLVITNGVWSDEQLQDIFLELKKYQEKYRFKIKDKLHWGDIFP